MTFLKQARELGDIQRYEADGDGRIYAEYENGAILPTGLTLSTLAGRSEITHDQFNGAVREEMRIREDGS